jgi:Fe2+ transport system protein FeoA
MTGARDVADGQRRLSDCAVGTAVRLSRITGPRLRRRRLAELGFVPGARIEVIGRGGVRGLVLAVNADTRVAIDAATAGDLWADLVPESA